MVSVYIFAKAFHFSVPYFISEDVYSTIEDVNSYCTANHGTPLSYTTESEYETATNWVWNQIINYPNDIDIRGYWTGMTYENNVS